MSSFQSSSVGAQRKLTHEEYAVVDLQCWGVSMPRGQEVEGRVKSCLTRVTEGRLQPDPVENLSEARPVAAGTAVEAALGDRFEREIGAVKFLVGGGHVNLVDGLGPKCGNAKQQCRFEHVDFKRNGRKSFKPLPWAQGISEIDVNPFNRFWLEPATPRWKMMETFGFEERAPTKAEAKAIEKEKSGEPVPAKIVSGDGPEGLAMEVFLGMELRNKACLNCKRIGVSPVGACKEPWRSFACRHCGSHYVLKTRCPNSVMKVNDAVKSGKKFYMPGGNYREFHKQARHFRHVKERMEGSGGGVGKFAFTSAPRCGLFTSCSALCH